MLRALTFDYWDTLYEGGARPERVALRRTAVGALLGAYGRNLPEPQLRALYDESGALIGNLPLEGEGVATPGDVTGVFVDGDDVYADRKSVV